MSVLKYKDSKGNWVALDELFVAGAPNLTIREEMITKTSSHTFDLTKYQHLGRVWIMFSLALGSVDYIKYVYDTATDTIMKNQDGSDGGAAVGVQGLVGAPAYRERYMFSDASGDGIIFSYENGILEFDSYNLTDVPVYIGANATVVYPDFE